MPPDALVSTSTLAPKSAAISTVRPGILASAVDAAARDVLVGHGLGEAFGHATGHGLGLDVPLEVSVGYGRSWDAAAH